MRHDSGMETMSALDASFLHVEDAVSHMHMGSVGIFEGPAPRQDAVLAAVAAKLHLVPRYRQRVRFPPLALARPIWAENGARLRAGCLRARLSIVSSRRGFS
jgi:diacylglycerol O-acyltransferase